jgi:hypothetical protein
MSTPANMSALEWFFRKPAASNFPFSPSSPTLKQLDRVASQLGKALSSASLPTKVDEQATLRGLATTFENVQTADRTTVFNILNDLNKLIPLIRSLGREVIPTVAEGANALVVTLMILAKESSDTEFREQVIAIAKSFAQQDEAEVAH